jgi:hypothetical protein
MLVSARPAAVFCGSVHFRELTTYLLETHLRYPAVCARLYVLYEQYEHTANYVRKHLGGLWNYRH